MKTKIITTLAVVLMAFTARPQIYLVDTNTPHAVGGTIIYGDPLPVAFTKIDLSLTWLNNFCVTNSTTNAALSAALQTLNTNLVTVSNMVAAAQASLLSFPGTNGGILFPSNTLSLATITNGMKAGDIITVNSNGLKLVDVWMSNSTPVLKPHW